MHDELENEPSRRAPYVAAAVLVVLLAAAVLVRARDDGGTGAVRGGPSPSARPRTADPGDEVVGLSGGHGFATAPDRFAFVANLRSSWPEPITVVGVDALATDRSVVPVELVTVLTDPLAAALGDHTVTPPPLPVEVPGAAEMRLLLRMTPDCAAPVTVSEFRLTMRVGGEVVERVLTPSPEQEGELAGRVLGICGKPAP